MRTWLSRLAHAVFAGIAVAVLAPVLAPQLTAALTNSGAAADLGARVVNIALGIASGLPWVWAEAALVLGIILVALALTVTTHGWLSRRSDGRRWDGSITFPSLPGTLAGVGALLLSTAVGLMLCGSGDPRGLIVLALSGYLLWRAAALSKRRWAWYLRAL
jgi:hypothetical protein